ncbi:MAG: phosphatidylglycerophosphate synthase [Phycisphaerales bacterium]|nr:phosphatidylglycerophosphate synthase [Phycisphaerales bacterium]
MGTARANLAPPDAAAAGDRRPLRSRSSRWAGALAAHLIRRGVSPNAISVASVAFAGAGALGLVLARADQLPAVLVDLLYLLAIVGIQGRLVCNLLDGMVAVEGGKGGPAGGVYNDLPDRLADPILLVAAGYGTNLWLGPEVGWLAAAGALLTAYVRVLGRSIGANTYFTGPMAKQHRMAVLTAACAVGAVVAWVPLAGGLRHWVMFAALAGIAGGCGVTVVRRVRLIVRDLEANKR